MIQSLAVKQFWLCQPGLILQQNLCGQWAVNCVQPTVISTVISGEYHVFLKRSKQLLVMPLIQTTFTRSPLIGSNKNSDFGNPV